MPVGIPESRSYLIHAVFSSMGSRWITSQHLKNMNGQAVGKPTSSPVWDAVSQWLAVTNPDMEYWWKLTGPYISHMMQAAGYTSETQYNALLFHYQWIVS